MSLQSTWHTSNSVKPEHSKLPIRQIYLWFIAADNFVAIVGKNNKFQLPGGKPEKDESQLETIHRELFDETGIILRNFAEMPQFFGYYLVEGDNNPRGAREPYLQLRYFIKVTNIHKEINLSIHERAEDLGQIELVKFVRLLDLPEDIPWIKELEEHKIVEELSAG